MIFNTVLQEKSKNSGSYICNHENINKKGYDFCTIVQYFCQEFSNGVVLCLFHFINRFVLAECIIFLNECT